MSDLTPITREEVFYQSILNGQIPNLTPVTRQEMYLAAIAARIAAGGGGTGSGGGVASVGGIYPDLSGNVALKKLTFTGAATGSYDGSEALSVEIPPKTYIGENGNWWIGDTDTGVSAGGSGGEIKDASITPEKTTFVELVKDTNSESVVLIAKSPTSWSSDNNWLFASNGSVIGNLANGLTEGTKASFLYKNKAFTGTVYVRELASATNINYSYNDYLVIADNEDAINNPSYDTLSSLKYSEKSSIFTIDGVANQQFMIKRDGTVEQVTGTYVAANADNNEAGVLHYKKFEIPDGKIGYLCTNHHYATTAASSGSGWVEGWNAVFSYNILSNPTVSVDENASSVETLKVKDNYEEGFMKFIARSVFFKRYFEDVIVSLLPSTTKAHTAGKSLYIGGDSLHQYSGGDGSKTSGFVTSYNKYLGFKTVANLGYAGSTWTGTDGGGGIKRVTDLVTAGIPYDVFILAWGTNDDTGGNGTIDDEASNAEGCTMVAAMKWCINQLRTTFRYSAIGIIIPPPKNYNEGMKEKGDLMISVCEQLHIPYVDMRRYLSMDDMSSDGVHLGYGADKYGSAEAKLILEICPYGDPL